VSTPFGALIFLVSLSVSGVAHAAEIRVTLFGQPCTLQGPAAEGSLKAIHAISPEQIYPTFEPGEKSSAVKVALEKLHANKDVPGGLDLYKELLGKRLEAQSAFLTGLEEAEKTKKSDAFLAKTKPFLSESRQKSFEMLAKKFDNPLTAVQRAETVQQLFLSFGDSLPSDPEEEFHKAIHRMKVQYICSFEESGEESGD
jgi:hypothetical protein